VTQQPAAPAPLRPADPSPGESARVPARPLVAIVLTTLLMLAIYTALSTASAGICRGPGTAPSGCVSVALTPSPVAQGLIILLGVVFGSMALRTTRAVIVLAAVTVVLILVQHAGLLGLDLGSWQPGQLVHLPFFSNGTVGYSQP